MHTVVIRPCNEPSALMLYLQFPILASFADLAQTALLKAVRVAVLSLLSCLASTIAIALSVDAAAVHLSVGAAAAGLVSHCS